MISPTQRPLSNNTQHSQQTDIYAQAGFETAIPASERPQTHALDRAATGTGSLLDKMHEGDMNMGMSEFLDRILGGGNSDITNIN